jgi:hypothetical protein
MMTIPPATNCNDGPGDISEESGAWHREEAGRRYLWSCQNLIRGGRFLYAIDYDHGHGSFPRLEL